MPSFFPEMGILANMFGFGHPQIMHAVLSAFTGKPQLITPRGLSNILSGKHQPKRDLLETMERHGVDPAQVRMARDLMDQMDDVTPLANEEGKVPSTAALKAMPLGIRHAGLDYLAGVIDNILEHEARAFAARASCRPQPEILKGGLAETILAPEEVNALLNANGDKAIGVALCPLRLKTPLYALAAWEVDFWSQCGDIADAPSELSARVADGGEDAFGVFINALIERTGQSAAEFAQKYVPGVKGGDSDEEAQIKKIHRWRNGQNVPHWKDMLELGRRLGEDDELAGNVEGVQPRIFFLFMLANYSSNTTKCAKRLGLRLEVGAEYRRFLDIHLAEIKKRERAE